MTPGRAVILVILLIAAAIAGAYYYFHGREYVYRFTEAQLQQALSERLPFTKTYLLIFQVTLDHPRVTLVNGSDRVRAGLDITFNVQLGDQPTPLSGSVDASGGVRYDPKAGQLFLTQPKIEQLELQGVPEKYTAGAAKALSRALETYYADHAILHTERIARERGRGSAGTEISHCSGPTVGCNSWHRDLSRCAEPGLSTSRCWAPWISLRNVGRLSMSGDCSRRSCSRLGLSVARRPSGRDPRPM